MRSHDYTLLDTYNGVLEIAESLLPSSVYNLLVLSLSLRQYSPTIEMFQQVCAPITADHTVLCGVTVLRLPWSN